MAKHTPRPTAIAKDALAVTGDAAATSARKLAALTDVGPFSGFKKFISRGSMIDMAVGVVMGSAVTGVVNAIVANLINPLIAALGGKADMSGILNVALPNNAVISFGAILNAILNFLLVGVAVYFCVILPINKLRDMTSAVLERDAAGAEADAESYIESGAKPGAKSGADGVAAESAATANVNAVSDADAVTGTVPDLGNARPVVAYSAGAIANLSAAAQSPTQSEVAARTLAVLEEIRDELRRTNAEREDSSRADVARAETSSTGDARAKTSHTDVSRASASHPDFTVSKTAE